MTTLEKLNNGMSLMNSDKPKKVSKDDYQITTLSKLKKGDYFKMLGKKTVYIYNGKPNRGYYSIIKFDDCLSSDRNIKKDCKVEINFEF